MPIEKTSPFSAEELEAYAAELEELAGSMRAAALVAEGLKKPLYVFRKSSLLLMRERMKSFQAELTESILQTKIGQPYGPDTQKGREAKKAAAKKAAPKKTAKKKKA